MRSRLGVPIREASSASRALAQAGSALIEAVIGIGLLAVLVGGIATTHRATTQALSRAEARSDALRAADRYLEFASAIERLPGNDDVPWDEPRTDMLVTVEHVDVAPVRPVCAATPTSAGARVHVRVSDTEHPGGAPTVVEGVARASAGPIVRLHMTTSTWTSVSSVAIDGVAGVGVVADGSGCVELHGLPPGQHRLHLQGSGVPLVDRTHVLLEDRPVVVRVLERDVAIGIDAAPAALVTVTPDARGGRMPDEVRPGILGWAVQDDDLRHVESLGVERAVHPGRVTLVVSACADPEAHASRGVVDLSPGARVTRMVRLATVTVDGVRDRTDAILELVRTEACGAGSRPSLRWVGGLSEGMTIALPAGVWEARLLTSTGSRLTAAVRLEASDLLTRVVLP